MKIRPLHDWAVIKRLIAEEKTSAGIIIPDSAKEKPAQGVITAIGPGRFVKESGKKDKFVPTTLTPGEIICFKDFKALDIEVDGQEITLIREEDILGTFELTEEKHQKNISSKPLKGSKPVSRKKIVSVKKLSKIKKAAKKSLKKTVSKISKKKKNKPVLKKIKTKKTAKKKILKKKK